MSHNHNRDYTQYHNNPQPQTEEVKAVLVTAIDDHDDQEVEMPIGVVVDCDRLNVRTQPSPMAAVVCTVARGEQLAIDKDESTDLFYKVYAEIGAEGYCMKQFIKIES